MVSHLVDHLDDEWSLLADNRTDTCLAWSVLCAPLAGCRTPAGVLAAVRDDPDTVLGFLIGRYRSHGETLAGRIVLQAMLGKLVRLSHSSAAYGEPDALDDLVAQMWCQIAVYPLDRRPRKVAANLAMDTFKVVRRGWLSSGEISMPTYAVIAVLLDQERPVTRDVMEEIPWTSEGIICAAFELSLITATTRDILLAVYGPEGLSGAAASERWACSEAAIRTRCRTAVKEQLAPLAQQAMLLAA